jgi:hypothetical protein
MKWRVGGGDRNINTFHFMTEERESERITEEWRKQSVTRQKRVRSKNTQTYTNTSHITHTHHRPAGYFEPSNNKEFHKTTFKKKNAKHTQTSSIFHISSAARVVSKKVLSQTLQAQSRRVYSSIHFLCF